MTKHIRPSQTIIQSSSQEHGGIFCKDFTNKYYFSQDSNKEGSRVTWNEMTTTLRLTHSLILPRLGSPPAGCECCEVNDIQLGGGAKITSVGSSVGFLS